MAQTNSEWEVSTRVTYTVSEGEPRIQIWFFQSSHSLLPGSATLCSVDPAAFYIPKGSFYQCSHKCSGLQSTEPSCHKWEWIGLAACGHTAISHELRSRSYNNLTNHIFFQVGFLPSLAPQNAQQQGWTALTLAQWSYKPGSRAGQGQDGGGVKFSHLQLPWDYTWEVFTARIQAAVVGQRKGWSYLCR